MLKVLRLIVLSAFALALCAQAAPAFAAPTEWESVDVQLQSDPQRAMVLVSGQLPAATKLPYEAELAAPAGAEVLWLGEILGGAPEQDPELKYEKTTKNGMDIYRFTLTKARIAQAEVSLPPVTTSNGTNLSTAFKWTAWQALPSVRLGQRLPSNTPIVEPAEGASMQPGPTGYSFYTKTMTDVKAGDELDLSFSYAPPTAGATGGAAASSSSSNTVILAIIIAAFVGAFALLALNVRKTLAEKNARADLAPEKTASSARPAQKRSAGVGTKAARATVDAADEADDDEAEPATASSSSGNKTMYIVAVALIGAIAMGVAIANTSGASVTGGRITRSFGATDPCQLETIAVAPANGVNLAEQGEQLLASLEGLEGVGDVTLDVEQSTIQIGFCDSSVSEDVLRERLNGTGLVTLGAVVGGNAPAPAAVPSATPAP